MNAILTMSSFIIPFFTFPYVSRILLPLGTGRVSFATSLIMYFSMLAQLGIPMYGIRACARVRDNPQELTKTAQEIFIINLMMSVLSYALFLVMLFTVPKLQADKALYIVVSSLIFFNLIGMEWLYKSLEQYKYIAMRSVAFKIVALIAVFLLIRKESDYIVYGGIVIFASSASNILNFINIHKYIKIKPVGNYNLKKHFKAVVVFFAMAVATTIYTQLDTVMLGFMKTDVDVGYYNAAVKIKTILLSVVTSLGAVLLPRSSYYVEHNLMDEFYRVSKKAINFVFLIAVPLVVYFMLYAPYGIRFLSGNAYDGSIIPMIIIMPTLLFIGLTNILGIQVLVPLGKEKNVLLSEIIGASVNIVINIVLIPKIASSGTAIGTLCAEIVVFIVQVIALRHIVGPAFRDVSYYKLGIGIILASLAAFWVPQLNLSNFLTLLISSICFFITYVLLLLVLRESLLTEIFRQLRTYVFKFFENILNKAK